MHTDKNINQCKYIKTKLDDTKSIIKWWPLKEKKKQAIKQADKQTNKQEKTNSSNRNGLCNKQTCLCINFNVKMYK